jgi:fibronectin type 3 domain-containing protein
MNARTILAGLLLALASPAHGTSVLEAQAPPPPLWLLPEGDAVTLLLAEVPTVHHGFVVYRAEGDAPFQRITEIPVVPVLDPWEAAGILGADLPGLMQLAEAETELALVRRIDSDPFTARALSILSRQAARVAGRIHVDQGVPDVPELRYRVVFVDAQGEETAGSVEGRVRPSEPRAVLAVETRAEAGDRHVEIQIGHPVYSGDADELALGFHVERTAPFPSGPEADPAGPLPFERITEFPVFRSAEDETRFVDRTVVNDRTYRYRVVPVDLDGMEGEPGAEVEVTPFDPRPPLAPQRLVTEPGDRRVTVAWTASPEPSVEGYRLERSTGLGEPFGPVHEGLLPVDEPLFEDATVTGGVQYFYRVVAVNARGVESPPTTPMAARPLDLEPPPPPSAPDVQVVDRVVELAWTPQSEKPLVGYHVYRGDHPGRVIRLTTEPTPEPRFLDQGFERSGLSPGSRYTYHVSAVDLSWNESDPLVLEVEIPDDEPPGAPTGLQLRSVLGRHLELRWSPGPSLDVSHYEITRLDGTEVGHRLQVPAGEERVVRDTVGLVHGASYLYQVAAVDRAGNVGEAATAEVRFVDPAPPPAPRFVEAAVADPSAGEGGGVAVAWERVVHPDLAGYRVERSALPTGVFEVVSGLVAPDEPRIFVDRDGTSRDFYRVVAVTRSGVPSRPSSPTRVQP